MDASGISGNMDRTAWTASGDGWVRADPWVCLAAAQVSRRYIPPPIMRTITHNVTSANNPPTTSFMVSQARVLGSPWRHAAACTVDVSRDRFATTSRRRGKLESAALLPFSREMFATAAKLSSAQPAFSELHKKYVMNLYRRYLRDSLNWHIRRDAWRLDAIRIRTEFEQHRHVRNPRELANILNQAEARLESRQHPDPYKRTY